MENTQNSQYGRTSQVRRVPGLDVTIRLCCQRSQKAKFQCLDLESGPMPEWYEAEALLSLGACTTPNISERHSGASACFLSAILEDNAPDRYSLSPKACAGILRRAERRGKDLPPLLKIALMKQAGMLVKPIEESETLAALNDQYLFSPQTVEILNDQGGDSMTVERSNVSPTLRSQTHGNLPIVAAGFDLQQITSKTNRSILRPVQPTLCESGRPHIVAGALCMGNGQANAGILDDQATTLTAVHEPPILIHPQIVGTLCASGVGLSRPGGVASETDFCVVSAGFSYKAGSASGSVGYQEETSPTLLAGQQSGIFQAYPVISAIDCRNHRESGGISGTLQAKTSSGGYSLNYQNPIRIGFCVRRLTPLEAERLQGFPDYWTECDDEGNPISDTKRYQMLGNSIAVPCVAYIIQGIQDVLNNAT